MALCSKELLVGLSGPGQHCAVHPAAEQLVRSTWMVRCSEYMVFTQLKDDGYGYAMVMLWLCYGDVVVMLWLQ